MTEKRVSSETERAVHAACAELPDRMSNSEIAAFFMMVATAYRVGKEDLVSIFGAMLQAIGAGHYDRLLAETEDDGEEGDEA